MRAPFLFAALSITGLAWATGVDAQAIILSPFPTPVLAAPAPPSLEIAVVTTEAAWVLADAKGRTLYVTDRDGTPGQSACVKICAEQWPPVLVAAAAPSSGPWSHVVRADQSLQWAYRGRPLYTYAKETVAGARYGERPENAAWRVAEEPLPMPSEATLVRRMGATVLGDLEGRALYVRGDDRIDSPQVSGRMPVSTPLPRLKSACAGTCLAEWQPLEAPWLAHPIGAWTVVVRSDGLHQWAYRDQALYVRPFAPKDAALDLDAGLGPWQPVVIVPAPPAPSWITQQATDGGMVYTDPRGLTLYAYEAEQNVNRPTGGASERGCNDYCMNEFRPVAAAADAGRVGEWLPVETAPDVRQWAYKGMLVYTHVKDRRPGDIVGTKAFRVWHTILPSGDPMQGTGGG